MSHTEQYYFDRDSLEKLLKEYKPPFGEVRGFVFTPRRIDSGTKPRIYAFPMVRTDHIRVLTDEQIKELSDDELTELKGINDLTEEQKQKLTEDEKQLLSTAKRAQRVDVLIENFETSFAGCPYPPEC